MAKLGVSVLACGGGPAAIGETLIVLATLVWGVLIIGYLCCALRDFETVKAEFLHPVRSGTPALLAVSTLLISMAVIPFSLVFAWLLAIGGIAWHVGFSLWHTGTLWKGGRDLMDMLPTLYLPTVAGNFTSAAVLGALGCPEWGWLFLGAGLFSWLALESQIVHRFCHLVAVPVSQRPLIGIQFAPPTVCAMACLTLSPGIADHWLLMLWGYGLFQLLLGLRLWAWLGAQTFTHSYWAYSFGIVAAAVTALKLSALGVAPARILAPPVFVATNVFIGYLSLRTAYRILLQRLPSQRFSATRRD